MPGRVLRTGVAGVFGVPLIGAGVLHFVRSAPYLAIMPPYFRAPLFWVLLSGAPEVLGGAGLMLRRFRRRAAYALALLMVTFMPVHVHMLLYPAEVSAAGVAPYLLFWRLALQFVLIALFIWLAEEA